MINKKENGITLVTIIITIIILVIVSAVSITIITKVNMINYATKAGMEYANQSQYEDEEFKGLEAKIEAALRNLSGEDKLQLTPNGNSKYQKEHSFKVDVNEEVKTLKYQWVKKGEKPVESNFIEINKAGETITKKDVSGIWYVCFLIETPDGQQTVQITDGFCFDNTNPTVKLDTKAISPTEFSLTAEADDTETEMLQYDFFVGNKPVKTVKTKEKTVSFIVESETTRGKECYVIVKDEAENVARDDITAKTQLYTWEQWNIYREHTLDSKETTKKGTYFFSLNYDIYKKAGEVSGKWLLELVNANVSWVDLDQYMNCYTIADNKVEILHMIAVKATNPNNKCINVNVYCASSFKTEQHKGDKKLGYVNGLTSTEYPTEAICGSFYYIYSGLK